MTVRYLGDSPKYMFVYQLKKISDAVARFKCSSSTLDRCFELPDQQLCRRYLIRIDVRFVQIYYCPKSLSQLVLSLCARTGGLPGGEIHLKASISSQFVSSLLISAPYAKKPVVLKLDVRS